MYSHPVFALVALLCAMADHIFRLTNTPLGTVRVKFYQIEPYSDNAFLRARAKEFLQTTPGSGNPWSLALYQGPIETNTVLPEAIAQLHARCPNCTAVRIEQDPTW